MMFKSQWFDLKKKDHKKNLEKPTASEMQKSRNHIPVKARQQEQRQVPEYSSSEQRRIWSGPWCEPLRGKCLPSEHLKWEEHK